MTDTPGTSALILAGAVAKGAFEAGALDAIVRGREPIHRIVATSSGALNGVMLAAAIRAGRAPEATRELIALWKHDATITQIFRPTVRGMLRGEGLSTGAGILQLLRNSVQPTPDNGPHQPVELTIVVAPAQGVERSLDGETFTTHERPLRFDGADFDTREGLEQIFNAALASSAFPGVFVPVTVPGVGPCFDGGAVDNTPVAEALEPPSAPYVAAVNRVLVVSPTPAVNPPSTYRGVGLISRLTEILLNERLYRDVLTARRINDILRAVDDLRDRRVLHDEAYEAVLKALARNGRALRRIEIVPVRPERDLPGNSFTGLFHRSYRDAYVAAGIEAAEGALMRHPRPTIPWHWRT